MRLGHHFLDHAACHVREPEIAPRVAESQSRMVDAEQVQDGGMEVVEVHGVGNDLNAVVVGPAIRSAAFDAGTRAPGAVSARMMLTPFGVAQGRERCPATL